MDTPTAPDTLCRDCFFWFDGRQSPRSCPSCGAPRRISHPELRALSIAHIDCDAFYASVEKRDDPTLVDKPVIVGGGRRGVVSAACYVARIHGVRSAMPMFKALALCPDAVVIKPDMQKYGAVGREIREIMRSATPLVEPISIDEAFLDLTGTERLHGGPPAETLVRLVRRIETEVGVTASIGLSYNKFLAKVASDLDKPRGFGLIARADAVAFLAERPVSTIWGVGKSLHAALAKDGLRTIGDLQGMDERTLMTRYGSIGKRLARFSHGQDDRKVDPGGGAKSVSTETTFNEDLRDLDALEPVLWNLAESLSGRLKNASLAGRAVTLKLKTAQFKLITRSKTLPAPTCLADTLFRSARPLLRKEVDGIRSYRLMGIGVADLADAALADPPDLADPDLEKRKRIEAAMDRVRDKLGRDAITKGRGLNADIRQQSPSKSLKEEE